MKRLVKPVANDLLQYKVKLYAGEACGGTCENRVCSGNSGRNCTNKTCSR